MAIPAGPTGPFVLSLSKDRLRVFGLIEIANPRIEYGVTMTKSVRMSGLTGRPTTGPYRRSKTGQRLNNANPSCYS